MKLQYHAGVWYMAILSGTLAYFLYVRGQKSIEVSEAALFNYLQPIFSIPLAVFWLQESLTPTFVIGAIIIACGVIIAEYKKKYKKSL
jgi:drug/metabolite transporter (DMT)-like permease